MAGHSASWASAPRSPSAQKRITAICAKAAELDGMLTVEWYEKNIKSRGDYANDAETLNRIAAELEEAYGN